MGASIAMGDSLTDVTIVPVESGFWNGNRSSRGQSEAVEHPPRPFVRP